MRRERAQVKIVGAEVELGPPGGAAHLGCLELWLDDSGDARGHFVLKVENVPQRTLEAVSPEMRPSKDLVSRCG